MAPGPTGRSPWAWGSILLLLRDQFLDLLPQDLLSLDSSIIQLAIPAITHEAFFVDQIDTGPVLIPPRRPGFTVVVDGNRVVELVVFHLGPNARDVLLALGFRRMDTNDGDALLTELLLPFPVPGIVVDAIDSAKGPEVDDDDLPLQIFQRQRFAVDPVIEVLKYGIKNIKRIGTLEFTDRRPADYWAERGYDWYAGH